ncbi:DUF4139 domain-containing protein [Streptomyces sp. NPDC052023]|uniref:DUF4139 domain-containing protein n=1 Tax=Streptomyces sp. NPDC052023 TaxID=3365681 RepID=UPI0037CEBAE3
MRAETVPSWASTLDSVVVYAQGALCRRLARGRMPVDGRVRVTGLPRSMDPGSLRVRVVGVSGVRATEARTEVDAEPLGTRPLGELRREVERLRDAAEAAQARRNRQQKLIDEVAALRPVPPPRKKEDPHRRTPVDAWLELADFVDARLTVLHARLREADDELTGVEHELDIASDKLARASTDTAAAHVETAICAVVTLTGAQDTDSEVELEVEYGVPGAVWAPAYRLTYRQGESDGRLLLRAAVAQRTGEDWTGVHVSLATADLRRHTDAPRLRSLRIGRSQPAPAPSGWREPPRGLTDLFAGYDAAGPRPASGRLAVPDAAVRTPEAGASPRLLPSPPPPPPASYGAPSAVPPAPSGAAPGPGPVAPSAPAAGGHAPPAFGRDSTSRTRALPTAAPAMAPAAVGRAVPPPAPAPQPPSAPPTPLVPGPPQPSAAELDYTALVLCGPEVQGDRRGRLYPGSNSDPLTYEYRRRAEAVAALPLPGNARRPRESAGSFDHRYDAVARADVPSDGTWHTVTVGEVQVGLRTEYLCVPSVEQAVYTTLVLSNATDQALLAGPLEIACDGDFLLTTSLPTLAPGGVCRVGLGPNEAIGVTRRTSMRESTSGLRNNVTVLDHRVHVELANRLTFPVTVEVRERVPVTSEADVKMEEKADWKAPADGTDAEEHAAGTRLWRIELPARTTASLDGGYVIRIPASAALTGGNRRS